MIFSKEKAESVLNISIENVDLFETAFTHRSYLNEHPEYNHPSNERLEFLGDAVLQLLSSEFLHKNYDKPEGVLTNYRSSIVCTKSLAHEAKRLNYGELLYLSRGEEASGGRARPYILANTFEAVLGAMYLDKGIEFCRDFVTKELFYKMNEIIESDTYKDAKSKFQELAQELKGVTPEYKVIEAWGADHEKTFKIGVYLKDDLYGVGEGSSKQKGEQQAAIDALDKLNGL